MSSLFSWLMVLLSCSVGGTWCNKEVQLWGRVVGAWCNMEVLWSGRLGGVWCNKEGHCWSLQKFLTERVVLFVVGFLHQWLTVNKTPVNKEKLK